MMFFWGVFSKTERTNNIFQGWAKFMLCCLPKQKNTNKFSTIHEIFFCTPHLGSQVTPTKFSGTYCCKELFLLIFLFGCFQMIKKHPDSRIVHNQLIPHQVCCATVVAKQKIQVFALFDYFGEFIVPCRGKWLLKGVPKMFSKTTWNLAWVFIRLISQIFSKCYPTKP